MAKKLTLQKLIKKAQPIFNKWIRERDKDLPCISCGQYKDEYDCGHFFPVSTHAGLRFDEENCHKECRYCNRFNEGHLIGYDENLRIRLGEERYHALKQRAAHYKRNGYKFSRMEVEEIIEKYRL